MYYQFWFILGLWIKMKMVIYFVGIKGIVVLAYQNYQQSFYKNIQKMSKLYTQSQLKKHLTPDQFQVIYRKQTQQPFKNKFWNFFKPGTYKCKVCHSPLFLSEHKYEDGFGWPAFYDEHPLANIKKVQNHQLDYIRYQVSCGRCGSHIGDKTRKRYCVNSASLKFYPFNPSKNAH